MAVARRQLGPRVADADDRAAAEMIVRVTLIAQPGTMDEAHLVIAAEPFLAAEFCLIHVNSFECVLERVPLSPRAAQSKCPFHSARETAKARDAR